MCSSLTATLPNIRIDSIQRIENFKQWELYNVKKREVASRNVNIPNEKLVYLGVNGSLNVVFSRSVSNSFLASYIEI